MRHDESNLKREQPCKTQFVSSELREEKSQPQEYLVEGVKALISALKTWLRREVKTPRVDIIFMSIIGTDVLVLVKQEVFSGL